MTRWWFQRFFIFSPILVEDEPILTCAYFSDGWGGSTTTNKPWGLPGTSTGCQHLRLRQSTLRRPLVRPTSAPSLATTAWPPPCAGTVGTQWYGSGTWEVSRKLGNLQLRCYVLLVFWMCVFLFFFGMLVCCYLYRYRRSEVMSWGWCSSLELESVERKVETYKKRSKKCEKSICSDSKIPKKGHLTLQFAHGGEVFGSGFRERIVAVIAWSSKSYLQSIRCWWEEVTLLAAFSYLYYGQRFARQIFCHQRSRLQGMSKVDKHCTWKISWIQNLWLCKSKSPGRSEQCFLQLAVDTRWGTKESWRSTGVAWTLSRLYLSWTERLCKIVFLLQKVFFCFCLDVVVFVFVCLFVCLLACWLACLLLFWLIDSLCFVPENLLIQPMISWCLRSAHILPLPIFGGIIICGNAGNDKLLGGPYQLVSG